MIVISLIVVDEFGRISGDPSETSSLAHSMDGEEDWIWGGEGPGFVDVQEIRAQLAFSGSLQALREIRSVQYRSLPFLLDYNLYCTFSV